jgi:hypothetical protein
MAEARQRVVRIPPAFSAGPRAVAAPSAELIIPSDPPAAPPFPIHVLPDPIRQFVEAVAASIPVPVDLVAVPVLVTLATAIGTQRSVSPKRGWTEYPVLYGAVVAESGVGKSPAIKKAMGPLLRRQARAYDEWRARQQVWRSLPDSERAKQPPPSLEHVVTTDATMEALTHMMATSRHGVVLYRDELPGWLASMDQYRGGRGGDRQRWLDIWSGTPVKVDRRGDQDPIFVARPFVSVIGGFTPNHFTDFLGRVHREEDDGFYARLLVSYPTNQTSGSSRVEVPADLEATYDSTIDALFELRPNGSDDGYSRAPLTLAPDAAELWWGWHANICEERGALPPVLRTKWPKLAATSFRLALVLHEAQAPGAAIGPISTETIAAAIQCTEYFMGHERHISAVARIDSAEQRDRLVYTWLTRRDLPRATARDIQRSGVAGVKTASLAREIMRSLVDRGWVVTDGKAMWTA